MQSSTNCNVLAAKGDSCHPQTSWLHMQPPQPPATGILEAQNRVGMGSARARADEQERPQSSLPLQWVEQAWTVLPNPSFEILHLSAARQPQDLAAALLLQAPGEDKDRGMLTWCSPDILPLLLGKESRFQFLHLLNSWENRLFIC